MYYVLKVNSYDNLFINGVALKQKMLLFIKKAQEKSISTAAFLIFEMVEKSENDFFLLKLQLK